ncbi:carboxypeptidase regulatory-like domain-containing protein [Actinoplanes sp. TBRC 11911]|uniref:carboxypeptidase-like regulatory domain-containing protein n=1 Tax=Actinoplanes sp. TBRC 11911 TaxID=2729386 RepID=UPI00145FB11B|nr:carboxypeptidase-like regulatory domain-containing protein [Actinoplanes sp. TBRC 11911]NMO51394.1 carboxypeptidase regulatory-like domain-containing protein [Actinoplanes sp. TBRC 11911]
MQSSRVLRRTVLAAALAGVAAATTAAAPAFAGEATGSLSGVVRDTRGAVVRDAIVSAYLTPSGDPIQALATDAHGRFRMAGLKAGTYQLQIGMGGWSEWAPGRVTDPAQAGSYRVRAHHDTVANSKVTAAGTIAGRFFTADGKPAANAAVRISNVNTATETTGSTAADGTFRIAVQPNQTFVVSYAAGAITEYVPHTFNSSEATNFFVRSGATVKITDRAIAAAGISGRVTDAAGAPATGVTVSVMNVDTTAELGTVTGADGSYDFAGRLVPGRYQVRFSAGEHSQDAAEIVALASGQTTVVDAQLAWTVAVG